MRSANLSPWRGWCVGRHGAARCKESRRGGGLARAHARSGDPVAIAVYLGDSDAFDQSITDFSQRYANQNERDYQECITAVRSGRLEARQGV